MDGPVIPRRAASVFEEAVGPVQVEATSALPVLARLPALDSVALAPPAGPQSPRGDGRILGASLSAKLLVGVGVALLAAALLPFALRAKTKPGSDETGLPAWHPGPPAPNAAEAPIWPPAGGPSGGAAAPVAGAASCGVAPTASRDGGAERSWAPPEPATRPESRSPGSPQGRLADAPSWNAPPPIAVEVRQLPPPSWPTTGQAPRSSATTSAVAPAWPSPAEGMANQPSQLDDAPPYTPWTPPGTSEPARTADRRAVEPPAWPDAATAGPRGAEPGVARFEGTIEKPPAGNDHERPGSSLY